MKRLFIFLFIAASGLELGGLLFNIPVTNTIAKPLIVLALIGYYLTSTSQRSIVFLTGLLFCWAGDVLLMLDGELFFILGLVAFLLGHVFYILAYRQHSYADATEELLNTQKIRFSLPIVLAGTGLVVVLQPKLGVLQLPVMIYAVVIIIMVMNALFRFGKTSSASFWMVFGGALLFQVSDSLLAINKFHSAIPMGNFWIMLTYIGAQYLIVRGLLRISREHPKIQVIKQRFTMTDKESLGIRIFHIIWKIVIVIAIIYYIMTEYVLYFYLKNHYKTTIGIVIGTGNSSDGGVMYEYEYSVDGVKYSHSTFVDYRNPPVIGGKYTVKYLEFMPSIASGQF